MEIILTLILITNLILIFQAHDNKKFMKAVLKEKLPAISSLTIAYELLVERVNKLKKEVEKLKSQS